MRCTMCGREITNPDANYCDYCGTALGDAAYREEQPEQHTTKEDAQKADRVPTGVFLGVMCLPIIPFVGTLAYLVVLFYWAFAAGIEDSRKSFARATLIYTAAALVLAFVVVGAMIGSMMTVFPGLS